MVQKAFDYLFDTMGTALGYDPKVLAMVTGLFLGFLAGLGIYRFFYGGKVQGLEEQIKLLDRQKADLERQREELEKVVKTLREAQSQGNGKELSASVGKLSLEFNPRRAHVLEGELIQCFLTVRNTGAAPVEKAAVIIEDLQSLSNPTEMERHLTRYKGLSLMLKEDIYKQNDLPKKEFYIFGYADVELIAMRAVVSSSWLSLEHTEYWVGYALTSNNLRARELSVPNQLPEGKYRLHFILRGSDGTAQRKTFLVGLDTEQFHFGEDPQN